MLPSGVYLYDTTVTATAQYGRPDADLSVSRWAPSSGTDLFAMVDEATRDDGDYIQITNPVAGEYVEFSLSDVLDPSSSSGHRTRIALQAVGASTTFDLSLRQGTSALDSWNVTVAAGATTLDVHDFSGAVADSITNYADVRVRIAAHG